MSAPSASASLEATLGTSPLSLGPKVLRLGLALISGIQNLLEDINSLVLACSITM